MTEFAFTVYGKPEPAGSKRALPLGGASGGRAIVVDANKKAAPWKHHVAEVARSVYHAPMLTGPVEVSFTFYRPRPKSHYGSGKNSEKLKASSPDYPETRPDALKLARGAEDALTGILWRDDAQIVEETLSKRWSDHARMDVFVRSLSEQTWEKEGAA